MSPICKLIWLTLPLLSGCVALTLEKPKAEAPGEIRIPASWKSAGEGSDGKISTGWLRSFGDADMRRLVKEALANNKNVLAAAAQLRSAKQSSIIGRAQRLPSLNVGGSGSHNRSGNGPDTAVTYSNSFGLSLNGSWEADVWGRLRDLSNASYQDYVVAQADYRAARLSLAANTARAWLNLISARQQEENALATRDAFQKNLDIVERMYKGADDTASPLDVQLGRNNVASAERTLVIRKLARTEAARALEVLLGRYPAAEIKDRNDLPELKGSVPAGLPSELLLRRPDLIAAVAQLRASANRADAARKDLLPSVNLSGGGSTSSDAVRKILLDPEYLVFNAAASLAQTVYRGGAPSAQAKQALEQNKIAIKRFADTALRAYQEVESALATERSLGEQEKFLSVELAQAELAEETARRNFFEIGTGSILQILESERRAVNARNSIISLRNQRLQNRIDLFLALGGDFATKGEL